MAPLRAGDRQLWRPKFELAFKHGPQASEPLRSPPPADCRTAPLATPEDRIILVILNHGLGLEDPSASNFLTRIMRS